ncbi:MAG: hypothetical protein RXO76_06890 [Vulcanisaeta sp.]
MLRRSVAVELEVAKELNRLLCSVESVYLGIVREALIVSERSSGLDSITKAYLPITRPQCPLVLRSLFMLLNYEQESTCSNKIV